MSTSTKHPGSIRVGGPGASHENAKEPEKTKARSGKPGGQGAAGHSDVSGGGGEPDSHHTHDTYRKGGST